MKIIADYHTHTIYSKGHLPFVVNHAEGTIEENVKQAINRGLRTIGISDHGFGHLIFGLRKSDLKEIRSEIDRLNKKYQEIDILLGVEANIMNVKGELDIPQDLIGVFDYINAGYHFGSNARNFSELSSHIRNILPQGRATIERNTESLVNAIEKNNIFYITHPGDKGMVDIVEVARAAVANKTGLEINGGHGRLSVDDLKKIEHLHPDLYLGSDAHKAMMVGELSKGIQVALDSGIDLNLIKNIEID